MICLAILSSLGLPACEVWREPHLVRPAATSMLPDWYQAVLVFVALATTSVLFLRPAWAWLPGMAWLGAVAAAWPFLFEGRLLPSFWVAAIGGGAFVLAASLTEQRGRASPPKPASIDVSVFD